MINKTPIARGMYNGFASRTGKASVNFRNETGLRDNVSSIEFRNATNALVSEVVIDPKDNVAMALSILGLGRLTDDVEALAETQAGRLLNAEYAADVDSALKQAVINLRAVIIAQKRLEEISAKDLDQAYELYKLSYPRTSVSREEFTTASMASFWLTTLQKIRKDPSALGAL